MMKSKVQPLVDAPFFYEHGDIIVGKCKDTPPWPAMVRCFKGYDEHEVQVYAVDFFSSKSYAYLETYLMVPFTDHVIKKMKKRYHSHKQIGKAISMAERSLNILRSEAENNPAKQQRFQRMYHPEKDLDYGLFEDVDSITMEDTEHIPKIEECCMDNNGNKKKSREFVKSKLDISRSTIDMSIEVTQAFSIGNVRHISTKIQEGPFMTNKNPKRDAAKIKDLNFQHSIENIENKQASQSVWIRGKGNNCQMKITATSRMIL